MPNTSPESLVVPAFPEGRSPSLAVCGGAPLEIRSLPHAELGHSQVFQQIESQRRTYHARGAPREVTGMPVPSRARGFRAEASDNLEPGREGEKKAAEQRHCTGRERALSRRQWLNGLCSRERQELPKGRR